MPRSAEVRLIQKLQMRVLQRTRSYDAAVPEQLRVTEEAKDDADEVAHKQGKVGTLTRKLANRINKEQQANNR